jgi:hypothetical protein
VRVMFESHEDAHHARGKLISTLEEVKALLAEDQGFLRPRVQAVLQETLGSQDDRGARRGEGRTDAGACSAIAAATMAARSWAGSASWSCACRRTGPAAPRRVPHTVAATPVRAYCFLPMKSGILESPSTDLSLHLVAYARRPGR